MILTVKTCLDDLVLGLLNVLTAVVISSTTSTDFEICVRRHEMSTLAYQVNMA